MPSTTTSTPPSARTDDSDRKRPAVWVMRADKYIDHFVNGRYVGVEALDLTKTPTKQQLVEEYTRKNPDATTGKKTADIPQLLNFRLEMTVGDYVVTPTVYGKWIRYGRISGQPTHFDGEDGCPMRNRRRVRWADDWIAWSRLGARVQAILQGDPQFARVCPVSPPTDFLSAVGWDPRTDEFGLRGTVGGKRRATPSTGEPFDPTQITMRTAGPTVEQVVRRIKEGGIELAPGFQRNRGLWGLDIKSRLIESLLLRIPIPAFYVASDDEDRWEVVDGLQRMSTLSEYLSGEFALTDLEYRTDLENTHFADLPSAMKRRVAETNLVVNVVEPGSPPDLTFNIFKRINTHGVHLNYQEIRHAIHPDPARSLLGTLAKSKAFLLATDESVPTHRMEDRELVLRYLAFHIDDWRTYNARTLDAFLSQTMRAINRSEKSERDRYRSDFERAMRAAYSIFGPTGFRKSARAKVNKALFETWSVHLAKRTSRDISILESQGNEVKRRFDKLLETARFDESISEGTTSPRSVETRFSAVHDLIMEFL